MNEDTGWETQLFLQHPGSASEKAKIVTGDACTRVLTEPASCGIMHQGEVGEQSSPEPFWATKLSLQVSCLTSGCLKGGVYVPGICPLVLSLLTSQDHRKCPLSLITTEVEQAPGAKIIRFGNTKPGYTQAPKSSGACWYLGQ